MKDSPKRPKTTDRVEDLPSAAKPAGRKEMPPKESGNVKGGGRQERAGTNDDSI